METAPRVWMSGVDTVHQTVTNAFKIAEDGFE
jgi:hypothetical protein